MRSKKLRRKVGGRKDLPQIDRGPVFEDLVLKLRMAEEGLGAGWLEVPREVSKRYFQDPQEILKRCFSQAKLGTSDGKLADGKD